MKEKKEKAPKGKVAVKADTAIAAYGLLTTPKTQERDGMKLSGLDTKDIFTVLRAANALKPVAVAFEDFRKDAQERLKPEGWDGKVERFAEATDEEKAEINKAAMEYNDRVNECVATELEKEKEVDAYERLSEEAFGKLVRDNGHLLDVRSILLLQEVLA